MKKISSREFCRNYVRDKNYNLYLLHFFMPAGIRDDALSLMALHTELKSIPEKARDPSMMIIRLKWWYDNVQLILNNQPCADSPVLETIAATLGNHQIPKSMFADYFTRFQNSIGGQASDTDAALYNFLDRLLFDKALKDRFSKLLQYNDQLADDCAFRALRLWFSDRRHR